MRPDIKFCGLTRPEDAERAAALGARYVGAIFAGGPRMLAPERAFAVLSAAGPNVRRVGVVADAGAPDLELLVETAGLHVIQLHGDPTASDVARARSRTQREIWAVLRVADNDLPGGRLPAELDALLDAADAALLDARVEGRLGGTGVPLAWEDLAVHLDRVRRGRRIVLAGGLNADNVARAVDALRPDIVDVSSGVESAPGVKDPARMRAFAEAVRR